MRAAVTAVAFAVTALAQPALTVSPKSGPPTDNVTISGTGFAADEAVYIYFDTTDLALAATNASGAFSGIGLNVPASATPAAHWFTGVGRTSGLAAQTIFLVHTAWPEFHRGPQRHGANSLENTLNTSNVGSMQVRWKAATGNQVNSSPAIADGVVCVGSFDYGVHAFKAATGLPLWLKLRLDN